jgi:threonine/homoserine/homoserine lactone efflux protein
MKKLIKIFWWGMLISFLGSLPLGVMNITATNISIQLGIKAGIIYAFGSMIVEIIVVRVTLVGIDWLTRRHRIFFFLELFTTALLLFIAIGCFIAAYEMKPFSGLVSAGSLNPFLTGALLSATNPLHIPFWLGWSTVLFDKGILKPSTFQYNWFVMGIGAGTIAGFMVFIFGGTYFVTRITQHQNILNLVIGIVLLITAFIQAKKIIVTPAAIRYAKMMQPAAV